MQTGFIAGPCTRTLRQAGGNPGTRAWYKSMSMAVLRVCDAFLTTGCVACIHWAMFSCSNDRPTGDQPTKDGKDMTSYWARRFESDDKNLKSTK